MGRAARRGRPRRRGPRNARARGDGGEWQTSRLSVLQTWLSTFRAQKSGPPLFGVGRSVSQTGVCRT
ncbi:hypothetical protein ACFPRL_14610 [Pseudoclavibacter helvolus]